jgi:hypothetical protein
MRLTRPALLSAALLACNDDRGGDDELGEAESSTSTSSTSGETGSSGTDTSPETSSTDASSTDASSETTTGDDGVKFDLAPEGDMNTEGCTCSDDLQAIVCDGVEVQDCTPGACVGGECIDDPCLAAELTKSSTGCDYWAVKTDLISDGSGACFAAFVVNTWVTPVHIEAEYEGQLLPASAIQTPVGQGQGLSYEPYDAQAGLDPGEVAILFIARENGFLPECPVPPALFDNIGVVGTGRGSAVNIRTDVPVAAYQILPYGGGSSAATSASLLLPTSAWDLNYVAVNAFEKSQAAPQAQPSLTIVAREDGTEVSLLPKVAILGGPGVAAGQANVPIQYVLDRGETLQISQDLELTGSAIEGNVPFGVFGAASCLNIPVDGFACDSAHQQLPPIRALGSEYVGVRYRARANMLEEVVPWTLVGVVDGTTLAWEPAIPPGAPTQLDPGQLVRFEAPGPFVVRSQDQDHPFYLGAHMTGGDNFGGEGDPEWVNVIPSGQYLRDYVLFTDPTYSETSLVVVRAQQNGSFEPVELDCLGELDGWTPLGDYEWTRVDLVTGNFMAVNGCENGRHEMWSDAPFGVTVWGWGSSASQLFTEYVSYAYPAGASVQSINEVVVPVG